MLIKRIRPDVTEGTLYHYCSAQALLSVLKNRTIRFSDVTLLNDREEAAWGYLPFRLLRWHGSNQFGRYQFAFVAALSRAKRFCGGSHPTVLSTSASIGERYGSNPTFYNVRSASVRF
jgi:hypothetical protein